MEASRAFEVLKEALGQLGFVRPGSLVRRFMPCGKPSCHCMAKPPVLHGPYYQWTIKTRGKTKTLRLSEEQARLCAQWIANHRRLKDIIRRMEVLSLRETDRLLRKVP
jgi:hypothetical protein